MHSFNIVQFLKEKQTFGFNNKTTKDEIIKKFGENFELEDYGSKGCYLHYDNFRFSIFNEQLHGIDLFFSNNISCFECSVSEQKFLINNNTTLLNILNLLNLLKLKWDIPFVKSNLDYLFIELYSGVYIIYYYEDEKLQRIGASFSY